MHFVVLSADFVLDDITDLDLVPFDVIILKLKLCNNKKTEITLT